ncbi:MAG: hypothetical protein M3R09_11550 [Actinomycetota bacterium]|nr:hypothetical protein [Actinomycetota bacterium]
MVTTVPPDIELVNRQSLSEQTLEEMATAAIAVIVGAWDEEGLLLWGRASGTNSIDSAAGPRVQGYARR